MTAYTRILEQYHQAEIISFVGEHLNVAEVKLDNGGIVINRSGGLYGWETISEEQHEEILAAMDAKERGET